MTAFKLPPLPDIEEVEEELCMTQEPLSAEDGIQLLADHGIEVSVDGKLLQDKSVHLFEDGHLFDFGQGGQHYRDANAFIAARPELHDAPVQAQTLRISTSRNYDVSEVHATYKRQWLQLPDQFRKAALTELLPEAYWTHTPSGIGFSFKDNSLTVSVGNPVEAVTIRRSGDTKWKTYGSKKFIPTRLTGKPKVYIASGMGEIVLMELMGWDYIGLQADGMVKHLQPTSSQIEHLIILPDNDDSFMKQVDNIVALLSPKRASMVRWDYADPRDAATELSPTQLQAAIDDGLDMILEPQTKAVSHHPLVDTFEERWTNPALINNVSSQKLRDAWAVNFHAFDECIKNNKTNSKAIKIVVPAITGSGKTQTMHHMARSLKGTDVSMLIVTSRTADADIACLDIKDNDNPAFCAVLHSNATINEAVIKTDFIHSAGYQVLIITHEMFRIALRDTHKLAVLTQSKHSRNDQRDLIVIDEQISLITEDSISYSMLDRVERVFDRLVLRKQHKDNKLLIEELEILKKRKQLLYDKLKSDNVESFTPLRPVAVTPEMYQTDKVAALYGSIPTLSEAKQILNGVLEFSKMSEMTKILESDEEFSISKMLGEKNADYKDGGYRLQLQNFISRYGVVFSNWAYFMKHGDDASFNTASEMFPNKSVVILDATSSENKLYSLYNLHHNNLEVKPQIECRRFTNLNIHLAETNTGRSSINKDLKAHMQLLMDEVRNVSSTDDQVMIVTTKGVQPSLMTYLSNEDSNIHLAYWGNLTGRNDWRECNIQFIYGQNHKDKRTIRNRHILAVKTDKAFDKDDESNQSEIALIEKTDRIQETIQAIMRTRARNVINEHGDNDPVDVYMTISPRDAPMLKAALRRYLPDVNISEWEIKTTATKQARGNYASAILAAIDYELREAGDQATIHQIKHQLDIDNDNFRKTINKESFKRDLKEMGFDIYHPAGQTDKRGRPVKGSKYFVRMK